MNNRKLLLILISLLAIYGLSQLFSDRPERSFQAELIQLDTAAVTSIVISPKAGGEDITLKREESGWIASQGERHTHALSSSVNSILANLGAIKTHRIAANSSDKWTEFEVEEDQGTHVRIYRNTDLLEDFIIGRFSFDQQRQTATSFVRLNGQHEVYAVDGLRVMSFDRNFNGYRDKSVLKLPAGAEIDQFTYRLPDTTYHFVKTQTGWMLNESLALDSAAVASFLDSLRGIAGQEFADDFDELQTDPLDTMQLTLRGAGLPVDLTITAFRDTLRTLPFIIYSEQNPDTYFASDSAGLYGRLFKPVESFAVE